MCFQEEVFLKRSPHLIVVWMRRWRQQNKLLDDSVLPLAVERKAEALVRLHQITFPFLNLRRGEQIGLHPQPIHEEKHPPIVLLQVFEELRDETVQSLWRKRVQRECAGSSYRFPYPHFTVRHQSGYLWRKRPFAYAPHDFIGQGLPHTFSQLVVFLVCKPPRMPVLC